MASIKFDTKKFEKDLKKIIEQKNKEIILKKQVESEGGKMRILKDTEKELLKIILSKKNENYTSTILYDDLPPYISEQLSDLLQILKYSGYCASVVRWMGGAQVTLTPEGINYFEKEEEYKKTNMGMGANININNLNANGSNINFGNVYDSTFNIDNSYKELERLIDENGNEDKEELKAILEEVKDYIDNISQSKTIGKNKSLFTKIGDHFQKHQWFYQSIVNLIGAEVIKVMSGNQYLP